MIPAGRWGLFSALFHDGNANYVPYIIWSFPSALMRQKHCTNGVIHFYRSFVSSAEFYKRVPYSILHTSYSEGPILTILIFESLFFFLWHSDVCMKLRTRYILYIHFLSIKKLGYGSCQCRQHFCPVGGAVVFFKALAELLYVELMLGWWWWGWWWGGSTSKRFFFNYFFYF